MYDFYPSTACCEGQCERVKVPPAIAAALRERERMWEAEKRYAGFEGMVQFIKDRLDEFYPKDIFDGSSGDSGPRFVVAVRKAVADLDALAPAAPKAEGRNHVEPVQTGCCIFHDQRAREQSTPPPPGGESVHKRHRWQYPLNGFAVRSCACGVVQKWGPKPAPPERKETGR